MEVIDLLLRFADLMLKIVALVCSVVAAIAIPVTLTMTWLTHRQRSTFEMIDKMYSLCHVLHDHVSRNWRVSHLFVITRPSYSDVKARIAADCKAVIDGAQATTTSPLACRHQLIDDERNFAIRVFITYEQVYYQLRHTGTRHPERRRFLEEMLNYFTDRLFRNPRLLAYLAAAGEDGSLLHLEYDSTQHLLNQVGRASLAEDVADMKGPFDYDPRSTALNAASA